MAKIKAKWLRVQDILSTLAMPPEKGRAWVFPTYPPTAIFHIRLSSRLLGLSAKHFAGGLQDLLWSLIFLAKLLKNVSKHLPRRCLLGAKESWDSLEFRQSAGQTLHLDSDSCPPADAKSAVLSNAKKVDAPDAPADTSNPCQTNPKANTKSRNGGGWMSALLFLLCLSIGSGGFQQRSVPALQRFALLGCKDCQEVAK